MPDKMKRNRFGREVTKTERYIGPPGISKGDKAKVKTKTVRKGNTLKTRQVIKQDGKRIVNKTKKYETGNNSVTKSTVREGGKTQRSVMTKKPGEKFTYANMGPASQARAYNYQVKKLKK
jgi:hypothetical protein